MFPYRRLSEILDYLHLKRDPIPLEELTNVFRISEKTLRNDIQNMNDVLRTHGACIERMRKKGYYITIHDSQRFQQFIDVQHHQPHQDDLDNAHKRITFILQHILFCERYITQDELCEMIYVSRNTIMNYLKTIKQLIDGYGLTLESKTNLGIRLLGSEEHKRACFMELLIPHDMQTFSYGFSKEEEQIFTGINLYAIEHIVLEYAKFHDVQFSDFNLRSFVLHIALLLIRIQQNCLIELKKKEDVDHHIRPLLTNIENYFQIDIPEGELHYLTSHFIANAKINYKSSESKAYLADIVQNLLHKIFTNYNFDLRGDQLLQDDLTLHFQSILNTKHYHLNKRNPLLNTIKTNYPLAYDVTMTCVHEVLEDEPYELTDDEIGYVSLHIGAAIERCFHAQIKKKAIIIVCGSGYATSRMLEAKLNNFFQDKVTVKGRYSCHEYQQMELLQIDFVISTVPIVQKNCPIIIVDFSLPKQDVEAISKMIALDDSTADKVDQFFEEALFMYSQSESKSTLLHELCQKLMVNNYVSADFEESVNRRESISATNMDTILAIPHPMEALAVHTKVAVAILKKPLLWNEKASVQIVLLLAINRHEQANIEHLYDTFIQIMNHPQMQSQLLHATTYPHFIDVLHMYHNQPDNTPPAAET